MKDAELAVIRQDYAREQLLANWKLIASVYKTMHKSKEVLKRYVGTQQCAREL